MRHHRWLMAGFAFLLSCATSWPQQYLISTVAGGAPPPTPGQALTLPIGASHNVATDPAGNVYLTSFNCVFKLGLNGIITRVAGTGKPGYTGDGGLATAAEVNNPLGIASDATGNLFIADSGNNRIRLVSANGIIVTVAGNGIAGFSGDTGPAITAEFSAPTDVAVDASGDVYIADSRNNRIREFTTTGIINTVAGTGVKGFAGDGGVATAARLNYPNGIAVDSAGNLLIADTNNARIRKVSTNGIIDTIASGGGAPTPPGGLPCGLGLIPYQACGPTGVAVDSSGDMFFADTFNNRVTEVSTVGTTAAFAGGLTNPRDVAVDGSGNLYVVDASNHIYRASPLGIITTAAGNGLAGFSGDGGPAASAQLSFPTWLTADGSGDLFIADNYRLRETFANGTINTVYGAIAGGPLGAGSLAVDASGSLYVVNGYFVQKISADGTVTIVAGNGTIGFAGDGGEATNAEIDPTAIAVDGLGNLYIAEHQHYRVRKVASNGVINTVAGTGTPGFSGDGGPAANATMYGPFSIAADSSGDLFIGDNYRVREITPDGIINTVAGNGGQAFIPTGDGGPAIDAQLFPNAIAVDGLGNLFIAVEGTNSVRKVSTSGIITTVAGNGTAGYYGDGGSSVYSELYLPSAVAADNSGNVYIADGNNVVRKLTRSSQAVLISAVLDAATETAEPVSPGKIVAIYGVGLGPAAGVVAAPSNGYFGTQLAGTTVSVNGVAAPVFYTSATQVDAIVPYEISGTVANITVSYQGGVSSALSLPIAASSPGFFSYNATGAGQAAAINVVDGTLNSPINPVKIGGYISFYATGEGQTTPGGVDGKLNGSLLPSPNLAVTATVGGLPATVQYKGGIYGVVAGLMQVNILIPAGVTSGGYVPVVLTVGNTSTVSGAVWIAVSS